MLSKQRVQSSRYTDCVGRGAERDADAAWGQSEVMIDCCGNRGLRRRWVEKE